ncbi:MAG TPA: flagellar hook-associated protein FlgL [Solirubrobacteraceae bacterium]|jgi:flagellar hook-associated protein 3 FlgL|nr:flagellar hook-associated protein FlgL [Solirubrobacteraceae bacterium]
MSERITSTMIAGTTLADINAALNGMQRSESELASGKSIQQPSDNPYGASRAIELQSTIDGMSSYAAGAQDGISWTQTASSALSNINEVGQRVRELLVQASNGVNNPIDRTAIAEEVDQLTATVKQDANTQYAGQYVFSGTLTATPPYKAGAEDEYQGNAGQITRTIGPGASVAINTNISSLLGNGQGSGDGKLLDTLRTISQHLRSGVPAEEAALGSTDLKNLDSNLQALTTMQAGAGAVTSQMRVAASRIEDLQITAAKALSSTQDADLAKVSVAYSSEQAAYNAALRAGASIVQTSLLDFLH